jgi:hypothetical protein
MRRRLSNPGTAARFGARANPDFDAAGVAEPPGPSGMFARLGVLLLIALGFGLAAQLLVGVPH